MNQTQKIPINPILAPDTLLKGGEYRIIRTLGQGGFGITYLAEHVSLGATVCIKEFYVKQLCQRTERDSVEPLSEDMREDMLLFKTKFLNEARKLSQMRHPNIVNVRDLFEENSTVYYVMEYIEGRSLNDIIKRNGRLSEENARRYISGVASALSYLHDRTMLHLDIKPDNIMVRNEDDSVVVIDFGLAKHYDPKTGKQTTIYLGAGTPGYSPFEQSLNGGGVVEFTAATDIYSLGATLFALVTGTIPPEATTIPDVGLPALPAELSNAMSKAITMAMTYSIKGRPQSIAEFMQLLNGNNAGGVVPPKKPTAPKKRSKWWLWLLLLAIVGGGVFAYLSSQPKDNPEPTDEQPSQPTAPASSPTQSGRNYTEYGGGYGISMKMVWVEGGTFQMGSFDGDGGHPVTLSGYWIAETEVTQAQWEAVMGTTVRQQRNLRDASLSLYGEGPNNPMYYVNYAEAMEFCRRLSSATGKRYTLPTEAQWEYAARGGQRANGTIFTYSGSNIIGNVAWYNENSSGQTHPVKSKQNGANQLGLYDMTGNVWEWCLDWYSYSYYSSSPQNNPQGPSSGQARVIRGGCWGSNASGCRVANRHNSIPSGRSYNNGFRVVCLP